MHTLALFSNEETHSLPKRTCKRKRKKKRGGGSFLKAIFKNSSINVTDLPASPWQFLLNCWLQLTNLHHCWKYEPCSHSLWDLYLCVYIFHRWLWDLIIIWNFLNGRLEPLHVYHMYNISMFTHGTADKW